MSNMSWKDKLDKLNEALSLADPIKGFASGLGYNISIEKLSISEQIEVINWFKDSGLWSSWDSGTQKLNEVICFHYILTKGNIELNAGYSNLYSAQYKKKKAFRPKIDLTKESLSRDDNSVLYYALSVIPFEHKGLEIFGPLIQEVKIKVVSSLLKIKKLPSF